LILVDTSLWIDALRDDGSPEAEWVRGNILEEAQLCTCGAIVTEILQGARSPREYRHANKLINELTYLPTPRSAYTLAADIYRAARTKGETTRSTVDCIIAACAIVNDVPLVQKDRDFVTIASVSDLQLIRL
jgi:predicted nucleic acid-binding protein